MNDTPRKPTGSSSEMNFFRRLQEELFERVRLIAGQGIAIDKTSRGWVIRNTQAREAGAGLHPFQLYIAGGKLYVNTGYVIWPRNLVGDEGVYAGTVLPLGCVGSGSVLTIPTLINYYAITDPFEADVFLSNCVTADATHGGSAQIVLKLVTDDYTVTTFSTGDEYTDLYAANGQTVSMVADDGRYNFAIGRVTWDGTTATITQFVRDHLRIWLPAAYLDDQGSGQTFPSSLPLVFKGNYRDACVYFTGDVVMDSDAHGNSIPYVHWPQDTSDYAIQKGPITQIRPLTNSPNPWRKMATFGTFLG